jgi:hypothetical protein
MLGRQGRNVQIALDELRGRDSVHSPVDAEDLVERLARTTQVGGRLRTGLSRDRDALGESRATAGVVQEEESSGHGGKGPR